MVEWGEPERPGRWATASFLLDSAGGMPLRCRRRILRAFTLLLASAFLPLAAAAEANVESEEKVLPLNGNLVPFSMSTPRPGAIIHNIWVDNE